MAELRDRAQARLTALQGRRDEIGAGLAAARAELDRRHPDPASVAPPDWATELGATQHIATARAALVAVRAEQDRIRAALAAVANPADTATFQDELRAALITDAGLRVRLRDGVERSAAATAMLTQWSALSARAAAAAGAAEAELATATRWQDDVDALRAALGDPPLDTVVANATAADFTPAQDRLAELLPDELLDRALTRSGEADAVGATAAGRAGTGEASRTAALATAYPLGAAATAAERSFLLAAAALRRYVGTATAESAGAVAALARVADVPDLSAAQQQALDPAARVDGAAAAVAEAALAAAVAALDAAERDVDDAVVAALLADPDADPTQEAAVLAAVQPRDSAAIQDPLTTARGEYDDAARDALDAWEVEVPDALWRAVVDFATATAALDRLADQAALDALVSDVDRAGDALADAHDARARQVRAELAVDAALVLRAGAAAAAGAAAPDRTDQYVRGDGPGGRVPAQL